jgi:hypothetical protein
MTVTTETKATQTARERFEQLISTYAPEIQQDGFRLTSESEYAEGLQSIQDHKYLTNEGIPFEITMEQTLFSWYENVYHPVTRVMDEEGLLRSFPGATRGELFLWVTRHWHFLKLEKGRDISVEEAVHSYGRNYGVGIFNRFLHRVKGVAA